jgi:acetyltransferase-like isoleucine patch superfamily enzyme
MTTFQNRLANLFQRLRRLQFRLLSDCRNVEGHPIVLQPVQMVGQGTIRFNGRVVLGCYPAAFYFNGYTYLEARSPGSIIEIGDEVYFNNNCVLVSDGPGIFIGKKTMLGAYCQIIDSDFHDLHPDRRINGVAKTGRVVIGENVLIGSNVKILKGVRIGKNAVIANGAVVTRSVPENAVVFGNPAKGGMGLAPEPAVESRSPQAVLS